MPLFDYRCKSCSRRFTALVGVIADGKQPACPSCGSEDLVKLMSRFGTPRSEDQILDELADIDKVGDIEEDPKRLKKWVREMGKAMDEDMEEELEELMDTADDEEGVGAGPGDSGQIY